MVKMSDARNFFHFFWSGASCGSCSCHRTEHSFVPSTRTARTHALVQHSFVSRDSSCRERRSLSGDRGGRRLAPAGAAPLRGASADVQDQHVAAQAGDGPPGPTAAPQGDPAHDPAASDGRRPLPLPPPRAQDGEELRIAAELRTMLGADSARVPPAMLQRFVRGCARVRSHCRSRYRGTEYVCEYGMKWMTGSTKG